MKNSRSEPLLDQNSVKVRTPRDYPWRVLSTILHDLEDSLSIEDRSMVAAIVRQRSFDSYLDLSEAWGPHGIASSGISVDQFFAKYQVSHLLKKFQFPTDAKARRAAALEKFFAAEQRCQDFNRVDAVGLARLSETTELNCYTLARQFLSRLLGEELPEEDQLTLWSRHGPGSNLDTKERRISLYDKYSAWPYSCTSGALRYARSAIAADERWLGALEDDYRRKNGIEPWRILDQEKFWASVLNVVSGNRICFVPKNARTDRSIAIEPCMNLYLQLGVDGYIRRRLKRWGFDLDSQEKNQELARLGSKYWRTSDPFVTLDLSAASDSISLELCRLLLPAQWYRYLIRLRSPVGVCDGKVLSYEKISSMGNGYTFALESAIFASVVYAVEMELKGRFDRNEVAVYGDDIIVRRSSCDWVVRMLNLFGFSLNHDKSFTSGPFRESCGADWFDGTPVRPVFLTSNPATVFELWNDANRLRRILSLRTMGFEFKVTQLIESWVPAMFKHVQGPCSDEDFDSYKHSPVPTVKHRYGLWKITRLVVLPKRVKGDNFLFRKLMHALRPAEPRHPWRRETWGGAKINVSGSRFTVTKVGSVIVSYSSSPVYNWQGEYNDLGPLKPD